MNKFTYSVNSILRSRDSHTQRHFLSSHEISNFFSVVPSPDLTRPAERFLFPKELQLVKASTIQHIVAGGKTHENEK
jgi:hypothetical protein